MISVKLEQKFHNKWHPLFSLLKTILVDQIKTQKPIYFEEVKHEKIHKEWRSFFGPEKRAIFLSCLYVPDS